MAGKYSRLLSASDRCPCGAGVMRNGTIFVCADPAGHIEWLNKKETSVPGPSIEPSQVTLQPA